MRVKLDREIPYELDGGDRTTVNSFKVDGEAGAITVCVPARPVALATPLPSSVVTQKPVDVGPLRGY